MPQERILIVDDEKNIVSSLKGILADEGYDVSVADDGLDALDIIQSDPPDLLLLDIWLPGMDGIEVLKTVKTYHPNIEVLIMSGHGTIDTAVKATKLGAYDFIEKPFSMDLLTQSVQSVFKVKKNFSSKSDNHLTNSNEAPMGFAALVEIKKAIKTHSQSNNPLLLLGEAGTGKEFIAQAIHNQSPQSRLPFIKINCTARRMHEIQSSLFPGSKKGRASENKNSTTKSTTGTSRIIFLDNVDALTKVMQEKLFNAMQARTKQLLPSRLYISSSKDLHELAKNGQFNTDLLKTFRDSTIHIPPLRENSSNIPMMTRDYLEEIAQKDGLSAPQVDSAALDALCRYSWPGNIRELRSVLDRIIATAPSRENISLSEIPPEIRQAEDQFKTVNLEKFESLKEAEQHWEKDYLLHHLKKNNWDARKTSKALKVDKDMFMEKIETHGIKFPSKESKGDNHSFPQRTLKRSMVLCGSGLHLGIKTGLILQPLPPGSGIIFGDISSGQTIPARIENIISTDYSTSLRKGRSSVATIEHIMAVLHMYRITNLLIKIGDEVPVMDGSAKDFCELIEDGEFEDQDEFYQELIIDKTYTFGSKENGKPHISIEPCETFKVSYHMEYPAPIGVMDHTFEYKDEESFKKEIAPARTFGFMQDVAQLTKMGFASGGKLDNFILLGDGKVINTQLRFENEFPRHKILDILGDFYLLGRPIRGHIHAHKSGHTQNIGLLKTLISAQQQ
ncbi:MAG: UDP-3-O-acyl-N-acetylglucosamine deacetylase [Nitrospinaceae bacterium]|nr:UDP-3-O-acyl-N-acetylglucosamine deacetylase [Nitrospinaceae bacterium]